MLVVLAAWSVPGLLTRRRRSYAGKWIAPFASRRWLVVAAIGLASLSIRAALLPIHPVPAPAVMDEYSYLLAGDTFASGRLVNPSHPCWIHFETLCEIVQPTYASKYPPGQGLVLALGILLLRNPWAGVWLSIGAMCAAMVWMLQGWLPPRWALLGGVLILVRTGLSSYWVDTYWGGAVAATGGALVWGALPRLLRRGGIGASLAMGTGLAILANSRPFEGLLAAAPAMAALAVWVLRRRWASLRTLAPMVGVLALTAVAMAVYNQAVTGSFWRMPYQLHEAQYAAAPLFVFQKMRPAPIYHHASMAGVWNGTAVEEYLLTFRMGLVRASLFKLSRVWDFFLGPILTVPMLCLPWALRNKRLRLVYLALAFFLAGTLAVIDVLPHYAAPGMALIYLALVQCLRHLRAGRPLARAASRAIPAVLVATVALLYGLEILGADFLHEHYSWCFARPGNWERVRIARQLEAMPGQHLVLVRYGPQHDPRREWVYNAADIDASRVVWAREMDADHNRTLLAYFPSRRVWLLEPDDPNPQVRPCPAAETTSALRTRTP